MKLYYNSETPRSVDPNHWEFSDDMLVWQMHTLPLGNGHFGASVYGYADEEHIQITENSFTNPYAKPNKEWRKRIAAGLTSFANIYIHFGHSKHTNYTRELSLDDAILRVRYEHGGAVYVREMFTSYPDNVLCIRIRREDGGRVNFSTRIEIPYIADWVNAPGDGLARDGSVIYKDGDAIAESRLSYYDVVGYGKLRVMATSGNVTTKDDGICVEGASEALLLFSVGTNYRMEQRVFLEEDRLKKLAPYPHPKQTVDETIDRASRMSYSELLDRHLDDYRPLFTSCSFTLDGGTNERTTTELVAMGKEGDVTPELASLMFAYGRYLLIASSRPGGLPANLQGIWSAFRSSPWSAGYWHNINVQMNYWASDVTGLGDCFTPYSDYNQAYMPLARRMADEYIREVMPSNLSTPGENGWTIGTGAWPYTISSPGGHSGPGTGAFTSLLFWDHYEYTADKDYLRQTAYPVLREMSLFFSKTLKFIDGRYLVEVSASPEQFDSDGSYHATVGCAFDQQMIYENYKRTLEAAEILGIDEPLLETIRQQMPLLDPMLIGEDGQVKEYREERHYGDIGEREHRHISHLVGLYPGTLINENTPEYLDAARVTLRLRGNGSSGWSRAHRLALWARAKDGDACMDIIRGFFRENVPDNLWDLHPPFQIDGNFGYTAGVAEMLMQSHAGYIELLPALPTLWQNGEFRGLRARGGFSVDCDFSCARPSKVRILSTAGEHLKLKAAGLAEAKISKNGAPISNITGDMLSCDTRSGEVIEIDFCH